jgi:hypothetical protein
MDKFQWKSQFNESTTKVGFQLKHIWANVLGNDYKFENTVHGGQKCCHILEFLKGVHVW